MAAPESQSAPESSPPDRWTVWAPRAAAVGCAVPASVCAFLFAAVAAMAGLSESALFLLPIGMTAVAASIGAALAWPAGVPIRIAFRALHGFAGGWSAGILLLFLPGRSPVVDQAAVLALPLGWGAVGAVGFLLLASKAPPWRARAGVVAVAALMTIHWYRVQFFAAPHAGRPMISLATVGEITSLTLSKDGGVLAIGSRQDESGTVQILDTSSGRARDLAVDQPVRSVSISPDGTTLVIASAGKESSTLHVRRLDTLRKLEDLATDGEVLSARYSPDGRYLATLVWNKPEDRTTVTVWDTAEWTAHLEIAALAGLLGRVPEPGGEMQSIRRDVLRATLVAFTPDSRSFVVLKRNGNSYPPSILEVYDLTAKTSRTITVNAEYAASMFCLRDGTILFMSRFNQQRFDPVNGSFEPPKSAAPWRFRPPVSLRRMFGPPGLEDYSPEPDCWSLSGDGRVMLMTGGRVVPRDGFPTYGNAMLLDTVAGAWLGERIYEKVDTWLGVAAISDDATTIALGLTSGPYSFGAAQRVDVFDVGAETNAPP